MSKAITVSDETYENIKGQIEEKIERKPAKKLKGMKYVVIRTYSAGCFAGYLKESECKDGVRTSILLQSRRLWYWSGASSLSQLAMEGVKNPDKCKFPCEIEGEHELTGVIETIETTKEAQNSIFNTPIWKQ